VSRIRASMALLGICVVALLIGALRLATERTPLPAGSSYSAQPDGVMALYVWAEVAGGRSRRLQELSIDGTPTTLVVVQPESQIDQRARDEFDGVPEHGGTLVVAGDSLAWLLYVRNLGVAAEPLPPAISAVTTPDGASVPVSARYRLRADGSKPLLVTSDGSVIALRAPYRQGSLVVIASPDPLTNAALRDDQTAEFVYREILSPTTGGLLTFDEIHHSFAPALPGTTTLNDLLFATAPGRALLYAALVLFAYLVLSGRRLGPPLPAMPPTEMRRTMYEHVQMLAGLYRRARQLETARSAFARHYARRASRVMNGRSSDALARIESARAEADLIAAVASIDDAG
jgi:hypothetical protein